MKTLSRVSLWMALIELVGLATHVYAQAGPPLSIQWLSNHTVQFTWTNTGEPLVLEQSSFLADFGPWELLTLP